MPSEDPQPANCDQRVGRGGDRKDFLVYMAMASDGAMAHKIQELKDSMSRRPIDRKRGPIVGEIWRLLIYGDQQMHGAEIKIVEIRQHLKDFERRKKEGRNWRDVITSKEK